MLATLGGALALLLGLAVLFLPLLIPELSRPRDAVWGAVVLLLGLVLVTSADRLTGAPMLGVLCGGLLIGRLAVEVGQGRWYRLTPEEQQKLWSLERWQTVLTQLREALTSLLMIGTAAGSAVGGWIAARRAAKTTVKRWVRPEATPAPVESAAQATGQAAEQPEPAAHPQTEPAPELSSAAAAATVIPSLEAIDALLDADSADPSGEPRQDPSVEAG